MGKLQMNTKGRRTAVMGFEFGEKLLWMKKKGNKTAKIPGRWSYGKFVGVRRRSGAVWIPKEG